MNEAAPRTPEEFFAGHEERYAVYARIREVVDGFAAPVEVRTSRSQVGFWRRHGFAYLWMPDQYLGARGSGLVLAVALGREDLSPRWKQVAHPSPRHWMHHLVVTAVEDVDDEVVAWLREAYDRAG